MALRCFVFTVLQWLEDNIEFGPVINGIVFNAKKFNHYVQIWVNDGFQCKSLAERYQSLIDTIIKPLEVSHGTQFTPIVEFFPQATYKDDQNIWSGPNAQLQSKKTQTYKSYGYKVTPFAQCLQEISPKILNIPQTPTFSMEVATIYKIPWSERRIRDLEGH